MIPLLGDYQSIGDVMKKGILVDFQADGVEVHIVGNGNDVLKAIELVLNSLDESCGSTALSDDVLERLILKRKQVKEQQNKPQSIIDDIISEGENKKTPSLMGLLMMAEAISAMKSGERESFTSFYDRFMNEFENRTGHVVKDRSKIKDHTSSPENLGNRKVGKIGIVIGKDPDKKIFSHPVLCNYVGETIPLYQDETGHFVLHFEEKVYLHEWTRDSLG